MCVPGHFGEVLCLLCEGCLQVVLAPGPRCADGGFLLTPAEGLQCGAEIRRCGGDTHSEPSQRSGFALPHIYNLSGFSPSLFINVCKNIKSPCILHQKLCQLLCFFLFIKTFQAVKTFYLLMRESGKINDREQDPPPRLLLTTHSRRAPCCTHFNFPVRVQ